MENKKIVKVAIEFDGTTHNLELSGFLFSGLGISENDGSEDVPSEAISVGLLGGMSLADMYSLGRAIGTSLEEVSEGEIVMELKSNLALEVSKIIDVLAKSLPNDENGDVNE